MAPGRYTNLTVETAGLKSGGDSSYSERGSNGSLISTVQNSVRDLPDVNGETVMDTRAAVADNFRQGLLGKRLTFAAEGDDGARVVIRELLYAATSEFFIFAESLAPERFSPQVFENTAEQQPHIKGKLLLSARGRSESASVLRGITHLIGPAKPFELRWSDVPSRVQYLVVDRKHVWMNERSEGEEQIIDMNASGPAGDIAQKLDRLWQVSRVAKGRLLFPEPA